MSSRTTSIGGVISLLGAFLASALVLGLLAAGLVMPAVGATGVDYVSVGALTHSAPVLDIALDLRET